MATMLTVALASGYTMHIHDGVVLLGSRSFIEDTRTALELLYQRDPGAHTFVTTSLDVIAEGRISRVYPGLPLNVMTESARSRAPGPMWYASNLAHEAYHVYLHDRPAPDGPSWRGLEAERACLTYQHAVASRLGADYALLHHIEHGLERRYWEVSPAAQTW